MGADHSPYDHTLTFTGGFATTATDDLAIYIDDNFNQSLFKSIHRTVQEADRSQKIYLNNLYNRSTWVNPRCISPPAQSRSSPCKVWKVRTAWSQNQKNQNRWWKWKRQFRRRVG